ALGPLPGGETVCFAPDAEQYKGRVERQRIERTDCHAEPLAASRHGCDNGDAGRKLAERVTETSSVQHGFPPVKFQRRSCYEVPIVNSRNKPCLPSSVFQVVEPIAPNFHRKCCSLRAGPAAKRRLCIITSTPSHPPPSPP